MARAPELREATIEYWWCGGESCKRLHKTKDVASRCPFRWLPDRHESFEQRNEVLWDRVVRGGLNLTEGAKQVSISPERARQIIVKMAGKRYRAAGAKRPHGRDWIDAVRRDFGNE